MKVLIIGMGAVGQRHARNLRTLLGAQLTLYALRQRGSRFALTNRMEIEPGVSVEDKFGLTTFTDQEAAFAMKPDAIIIANPSSMHLSTARQAVDTGGALFIEKPVSHQWEGVTELVDSVARKQAVTLVGCQWRFHPLLARAKALIEGGSIGHLIAVNASYGEHMPSWHPYEDYRQTYAARHDLGGGVLLTQIHDFDYLGWIVGWPEQVFSIGGHLSNLEISVEDTASTLMRCRLEDGRCIPIHIHQDYLQRPPVRGCEFIADNGKMHVDLLGGRLRVWDADGKCAIEEDFSFFDRNDMFVAEMRHFIACVKGREQSMIPVQEGAKSLSVALAAHASLKSGNAERVVYL